jgi:CUG-BP- and ETR3-like factor
VLACCCRYQTKSMADVAVQQFNMRHVLPDVTGEQQRPMVVRKANSRKPASMVLPQLSGGPLGASGNMGVMGLMGAEGSLPVQAVMNGQVSNGSFVCAARTCVRICFTY